MDFSIPEIIFLNEFIIKSDTISVIADYLINQRDEGSKFLLLIRISVMQP